MITKLPEICGCEESTLYRDLLVAVRISGATGDMPLHDDIRLATDLRDGPLVFPSEGSRREGE